MIKTEHKVFGRDLMLIEESADPRLLNFTFEESTDMDESRLFNRTMGNRDLTPV